MTGKTSDIDVSLTNFWRSWQDFRRGKRRSQSIETFEYYLEENLRQLQQDVTSSNYKHGGYQKFIVHDNKRREIAVADVRDRVVHRLLYNYLVPLFDKTFIYDAWSCRKGKGHHAAIARVQSLVSRYYNCWYWRTDITKFFDSINQTVMKELLWRKVKDPVARALMDEVINSYNVLASQPASLRSL